MNKREMRSFIGLFMDISHNRFSERDTNTLFNFVSQPDVYNGMSKTTRGSFTDWCSEGKYIRKYSNTYLPHVEVGNTFIQQNYDYFDDDGQHGSCSSKMTNVRQLLGILYDYFDM